MKNYRQFTLSILLILISSLISFGQVMNDSTLTSNDSIEWETFSTEEYEISYPTTWVIDTSGQMGTQFFLFSELEGSLDSIRENINLIIQDFSMNPMTLDEYVTLSEKQIVTLITEGKILLSERRNNRNLEFHNVIYAGKQGVFDLIYEQFYWMINDQTFILTLTCKSDAFEKYQDTGKKILSSFIIYELD